MTVRMGVFKIFLLKYDRTEILSIPLKGLSQREQLMNLLDQETDDYLPSSSFFYASN